MVWWVLLKRDTAHAAHGYRAFATSGQRAAAAYAAGMPSPSDNRQFMRVATEVEAEIRGAGGTVTGATRDLSLKGLFIHVAVPFPEGSTCRITLFLDGRGGDIDIEANGYVARSLIDGMAIEFTELIGLESWDHLRNLVLYNAEEPIRAQEQFAGHVGLKRR